MSRYVLTIHPDDATQWKNLTGRDETTAQPVESEAFLGYMLGWAARHGVLVTDWHEVEEEL